MIDKSELLEYFLSEAVDHISILENGIPELQDNKNKSNLIEELFRVAHTLKGSAALVKLTVTSNIAHKMEDILEALMNKRIEVNNKIIELLTNMLDIIKTLIYRVSKGDEESLDTEKAILEKANELLKDKISTDVKPDSFVTDMGDPISSHTTDTTSKTLHIADQQSESALTQSENIKFGRRKEDTQFFIGNFVKVDSQKIEDMLNLLGEVIIKKNYLLSKTKNITDTSDELFFTGRRLLNEVNEFAERYAYALPENVKYVDPLLSEFGELEFDRYDELNLFSRKLQEITNDITESLKELSNFFDFFSDDLKSMDRIIALLKSNLTESRMVEVGILFQRFIKPVKDIAKKHGKKVELQISGGLTKIDRVVFERLFNPLMHLIMNAIIHGIEPPEERVKKNKKAIGTIVLSAKKEGGIAVIEISDDGNGINTDAVFKEALKHGLLRAEDKPSKDVLLSLIFVPGLSTAETTDMDAGRGMGMIAAKRMISGINGILEVFSNEGIGTTFKIKVPLSLAIANVLLFRCGNLEFVIPSNFVEEVILLTEQVEKGLIEHRGEQINLFELSKLIGVRSKSEGPDKYIIVCNVSGKKIGLIVDEVIAQEETIIKTMHSFLEGLKIYSGTTISGDGNIRFVINPIILLEEQFEPLSDFYYEIQDFERKNILIVDDSLSVRKYTSSFLEAKNFNVYTASNGAEALNILYETHIDMIITDLEMPVMHGYEFITRVKSADEIKDIPIVVLTSRSGDKHKEKAMAVGVEDYLVKPFDESSLMNILKKYFMMSFT